LSEINIKKGHNIGIAGVPSTEVIQGFLAKTVSIQPTEFRGVKPKILVKEGDIVKVGSALFHDKKNPIVFINKSEIMNLIKKNNFKIVNTLFDVNTHTRKKHLLTINRYFLLKK